MTRRPDPARIADARRAATVARLVSSGVPVAMADERVRAWEASLGRPATRDDWERFERGRGPPQRRSADGFQDV